MLRSLLFWCLLLLVTPALSAQNLNLEGEFGQDWGGYLYGLKGGLSFGNQDWSGLETEFLIGYHGALFIESIPAGKRFSLYGQLGYHTRGSRISRRRAFTFNGSAIRLPSDDFRFYNVSLGVGAKSVVKYTRIADLYYLLGLRAEYSVSNNLSDYDRLTGTAGVAFRANYPFDSPMFINEFTYGVTFGGGAAFPLTEGMGGFVELAIQPDLNFQYNQGPIENVIDPYNGAPRTIPERMIRNITIELSVGLRFLRSYRYVD